MYIGKRKVDIEEQKADIEGREVHIDTSEDIDVNEMFGEKLADLSAKTISHIKKLYSQLGSEPFFGRSDVEKTILLKPAGASKFLKKLLEREVIEPVSGHGKGKYRLKL